MVADEVVRTDFAQVRAVMLVLHSFSSFILRPQFYPKIRVDDLDYVTEISHPESLGSDITEGIYTASTKKRAHCPFCSFAVLALPVECQVYPFQRIIITGAHTPSGDVLNVATYRFIADMTLFVIHSDKSIWCIYDPYWVRYFVVAVVRRPTEGLHDMAIGARQYVIETCITKQVIAIFEVCHRNLTVLTYAGNVYRYD
jgi:hypothetical protein